MMCVARQVALVTTFVLSRHDCVVFKGSTLIMSEQPLMYSKLNLKLWLIYNSHPSQKIISKIKTWIVFYEIGQRGYAGKS